MTHQRPQSYFSFYLFLPLVIFFLTSCSSEKIPRHQKVSNEISDRQSSESQPKNSSRFLNLSEQHLAIFSLIESNDVTQWSEALKSLNSQIFAENYRNNEIYASRSYAGFISLYVDLFYKWQGANLSDDHELSQQMGESLTRFQDVFINSCVSDNSCALVKNTFPKVHGLVDILLELIKKNPDPIKKLEIIGVAYEASNNRQRQSLSQEYINTYFLVRDSGVETSNLTRHAHNVIAIIQLMDWRQINDFQHSLIVRVKPWYRDEEAVDLVTLEIRSILRPKMAFIIGQRPELDQFFREDIYAYWQKELQRPENLGDYPAYRDIDVQSVFTGGLLEHHILLSLYFGEMTVSEASEFLSELSDRRGTLINIFNKARTLIRWDLAHLSLSSTKSIAEFYGRQATKTAAHVSATMDHAKSLHSLWSDFHDKRTLRLQTFLQAQQITLGEEKVSEIIKFFEAIDRNIMKIVIYPNMMAMIYEMVRSNWKDRILDRFDETADKIIELFFAGKFRGLWFDYGNSPDLGRGNLEEKRSLFRYEIVDVFYYFVAAGVYKIYDFNLDDVVLTLMKDLLFERESFIKAVQQAQRELYASPDTHARKWARWCEGLRNQTKVSEDLGYYQMDKNLIGFSHDFFKTIESRQANLFFTDEFYFPDFDTIISQNDDEIKYIHSLTAMARARQEVLPLLNNYNEIINIVKRLSSEHPGEFPNTLPRSKNYLQQIDSRTRSFFGQQIHYADIFDGCNYLTIKESRRRAKEVVLSEYEYLSQVVHPILSEVYNGSLSIVDGNSILKQVHDSSEEFQSQIIGAENGSPIVFKYAKRSYMYRIYKYLTTGMNFILPHLTSVNISPIVGSSLSISIPNNLQGDVENPYKNTFKRITFDSSLSSDQFARDMMLGLSDQLGFSPDINTFTSWGRDEVRHYISQVDSLETHQKSRVDFAVQHYLLNDYKVADYQKEECQSLQAILPESCFVLKPTSLEKITGLMEEIYQSIEISEADEVYLDLIDETDFLYRQNLGIQLRFDARLGTNQRKVNLMSAPENYPIPFFDLKGQYDLIMEMMGAPYLARGFVNDFYISLLSPARNDAGSSSGSLNRIYSFRSVDGERDQNHWENNLNRAKQFYEARERRSHFMFKFDPVILENQFHYVKNDVLTRFQAIEDMHANATRLFEQHRGPLPQEIKIHRTEPPYDLIPLSASSDHFLEDIKSFHLNLNSFYLQPNHDWSRYLWHQPIE